MTSPDTAFDDTAAEVTDWLPPDTSPVREGVYARQFPAGPYACWSAAGWHADSATAAEAAHRSGLSEIQHAAWRGLVHPSPLKCETCGGRGVFDRGIDEDTGDDLIDACADC